jgi:hypothetical protein
MLNLISLNLKAKLTAHTLKLGVLLLDFREVLEASYKET